MIESDRPRRTARGRFDAGFGKAVRMSNYELRSEILSSGTKYYLQSNLVPSQMAVVTSLFLEGNLLSKQSEHYDSSMTQDRLPAMVRRLHDGHKERITSLLKIRGIIKKNVDGRAHLKLGEALYKQKLFKEAMAETIRAIKLGLEESSAYSILGNCLLALGDSDKALKSFRRGIEFSPEYPDLHNDIGVTYLRLQRCREAAAAFEKALSLNRYYQEAFLNLALALSLNVVLKQDYELSRELKPRLSKILDMNIQLKPSLDTDEFKAARSALETERYDAVYDKLLSIKQEQDRMAQNDLSLELYLVLKFRSDELSEDDINRYIEKVQEALETTPGYADLKNDLGVLYTAKCKIFIDKANSSFQEALAINKNFKRAEKNLKLAVNDRQGIHFLLKALLD